MTSTDPAGTYALAIDLGTSGLKVGLVSLAGEVAWTTGAQIPTTLLPGGGAEQDPNEWWRVIRDAAKSAMGSGRSA